MPLEQENPPAEPTPDREDVPCIVTQGGVPCALYNAASLTRGGVLIPALCLPDGKIALFASARSARRAIGRSETVAKLLTGSLVDDWPRVRPLLNGASFEVCPLARA